MQHLAYFSKRSNMVPEPNARNGDSPEIHGPILQKGSDHVRLSNMVLSPNGLSMVFDSSFGVMVIAGRPGLHDLLQRVKRHGQTPI